MRFTFDAPSAEGLRVIPEIPDHALCQIEGRNGIGKTLAARLLELASGGQPFAALPSAWETLKGLGPLVIGVDGLPGPQGPLRLEFHMNPDDWPSEPAVGLSDQLGSVRIDGAHAEWAAARRLLRVVRIAGDESLVETLGRSLQEWSVQATSALRQLTPVVGRWDHDLSAVAALCNITSEELTSHREAAAACARFAKEVQLRYEQATQDAARIAGVRQQLEEALSRATKLPAAAERLEQARRTQAQRLADVRELERKSAAAIEARGRRREVDDAVTSWENKLVLRSRALNRALVAERQALAALNLTDRPSAEEIAGLTTSTGAEIAALKQRVAEVDSTGTVRQVGEQLERQLLNGPAPALRSVLAVLPELAITGDQLVAGLRERRTQLQGHPRAGELDGLERQGRALVYRFELLTRLPALVDASRRKQRNVDEAQRELRKLYAAGGSSPDSSLEIVEQQEQARSGLLAAGVELTQANAAASAILGLEPSVPSAGLEVEPEEDDSNEEADLVDPDPTEAARGGAELLTVADLERIWRERDKQGAEALATLGEPDLAAVLRGGQPGAEPLQLALTTVDQRLSAAKALADADQRALSDANERRGEAYQSLASLRTRLKSHVRELSTDDEWAPWRPGVESAFAQAGTSLAHAAEILADESAGERDAEELKCATALTRLAGVAEQLRESAAQTRDAFGALAGYLTHRAQTLAPRVAAPTDERISVDRRVGRTLLPWIEQRLSATLSAEELRNELFEGAPDVSLDLDRMQIAWRAKDGRTRRRPLEAFSSGEQVFAYTRAKLEQLSDLKSQHDAVVIILDEFGAFVARDRFGQLMSFVRHEALGPIADQIIVMLPLAVNYLADESASAVAESDHADPGSIADRVQQLRSRGYFAISGDYAS